MNSPAEAQIGTESLVAVPGPKIGPPRANPPALASAALLCTVAASLAAPVMAFQTLKAKSRTRPRKPITAFTPAIKRAGWDEMLQIREEVGFTKGRIIVRGKLVTRGKAKRADYVLYFKPNIPLALIEAKDNSHSVGDGMQQGLEYATTLDIPFVFSSNGDGFVFHDRIGASATKEANRRSRCPAS